MSADERFDRALDEVGDRRIAQARGRVQVAMRQARSWPPAPSEVDVLFDSHPAVISDLIDGLEGT